MALSFTGFVGNLLQDDEYRARIQVWIEESAGSVCLCFYVFVPLVFTCPFFGTWVTH